MSIVRLGMSETKNYAEGFEAIFGKKKKGAHKKSETAKSKTKSTETKKKTKK
ncbi:MAG: hypothetical protein ACFCD0_02075 [Gemmataceae bacterium]